MYVYMIKNIYIYTQPAPLILRCLTLKTNIGNAKEIMKQTESPKSTSTINSQEQQIQNNISYLFFSFSENA